MNRSDEKPEMSSLGKYPMRFLKSFCPDHLYEEIEGDLISEIWEGCKAIRRTEGVEKIDAECYTASPEGPEGA